MEIYCTRPACPRPQNHYPDLDDSATLKTVQQKFCTACGMPLILAGRYLPLRLLGQGGFGAAFLALDRYTPTMRQCVVKQFQPSGDLSPTQLQIAQNLFEREAEALEQLGNGHPLIPDLYAFFPLNVHSLHQSSQQEEFFYLVQEFIDGQDLEQELAQRGAFSEAEVQQVLTSTLKTLQFVHEHGTLHRDIKPSNIMRHRNGRLYLLDFGAVKQVTTKASPGQGSSTGIYSMGFAPPEQMAGGTVYPSTDLYALAVTCITLLTGKSPAELYDSYSNTWSWRAYASVSDRLEAVLNRMLLSSPSQRFQSAKEVLDALNPAAPTTLQPATPTPKPMGKTPAPAPVATAAPATPPIAVASPGPVAPAHPGSVAAVTPVPRSRFSILEFLGGAAFTGFEGSLLAIALFSWLGTLWAGGFWLILLGLLVFLQYRRTIERIDLLIIAAVTVAVVWFLIKPEALPLLQLGENPRLLMLFLAGLASLLAVAIAALFRLIYKVLSGVL